MNNTDTLILIYLVSAIVGLIILYYIIRSASGANERKKQLQLQNRLLLHIAKNTGTDISLIKELEDYNNEISA